MPLPTEQAEYRLADQGPAERGDVARAARDLGRPHRVEGAGAAPARPGARLPTTNLETTPYRAVPADGVHAGWLASLDGDGVETSPGRRDLVGTNPTFEGRERTVEAYALDRDDLDLYGVHVVVDFAQRLRGMVRFDSAADLIEQMYQDVDAARALVGEP